MFNHVGVVVKADPMSTRQFFPDRVLVQECVQAAKVTSLREQQGLRKLLLKAARNVRSNLAHRLKNCATLLYPDVVEVCAGDLPTVTCTQRGFSVKGATTCLRLLFV